MVRIQGQRSCFFVRLEDPNLHMDVRLKTSYGRHGRTSQMSWGRRHPRRHKFLPETAWEISHVKPITHAMANKAADREPRLICGESVGDLIDDLYLLLLPVVSLYHGWLLCFMSQFYSIDACKLAQLPVCGSRKIKTVGIIECR